MNAYGFLFKMKYVRNTFQVVLKTDVPLYSETIIQRQFYDVNKFKRILFRLPITQIKSDSFYIRKLKNSIGYKANVTRAIQIFENQYLHKNT